MMELEKGPRGAAPSVLPAAAPVARLIDGLGAALAGQPRGPGGLADDGHCATIRAPDSVRPARNASRRRLVRAAPRSSRAAPRGRGREITMTRNSQVLAWMLTCTFLTADARSGDTTAVPISGPTAEARPATMGGPAGAAGASPGACERICACVVRHGGDAEECADQCADTLENPSPRASCRARLDFWGLLDSCGNTCDSLAVGSGAGGKENKAGPRGGAPSPGPASTPSRSPAASAPPEGACERICACVVRHGGDAEECADQCADTLENPSPRASCRARLDFWGMLGSCGRHCDTLAGPPAGTSKEGKATPAEPESTATPCQRLARTCRRCSDGARRAACQLVAAAKDQEACRQELGDEDIKRNCR